MTIEDYKIEKLVCSVAGFATIIVLGSLLFFADVIMKNRLEKTNSSNVTTAINNGDDDLTINDYRARLLFYVLFLIGGVWVLKS